VVALCLPVVFLHVRYQPGFAIRYAEKTFTLLFGSDRIAVTCQRLGMSATGKNLAVDEHAVAIEDHEFN